MSSTESSGSPRLPPRGGRSALLAVVVRASGTAGSTLTAVVEHRASEDACWVALASFPTVTVPCTQILLPPRAERNLRFRFTTSDGSLEGVQAFFLRPPPPEDGARADDAAKPPQQ